MKLLIDCGNTRIKWALATAAGTVDSGDMPHRGRQDEAIAALLRLVSDAVTSAHVASVLDDEFTRRLLTRLRGVTDRVAVCEVVPEANAHGLRIAYADPGTLGVDRWLAMIAGRATATGAVCVVSAGTAVTFDAVAADGRHLGGFIWPGPRLAARALETETGRIGPTTVATERPAGLAVLGRTTNEAVGRGSLLAIAAGIDRAVKIVAAECGATSLLLTGGDAALLAPWLERPATLRADLVLDGLRTVAGEVE